MLFRAGLGEHPVPPLSLGLIEGPVGVPDEHPCGGLCRPAGGNADAGGEGKDFLFEEERVFPDLPDDPFAQPGSRFDVRFGKDDRKFIPPVAGGDIDEADGLEDEAADLTEDVISLEMAAGVVDCLETVQVDHHEGEGTTVSFGPRKFPLNRVDKVAVVVKSRQAVLFGLFPKEQFPLDLFFLFPPLFNGVSDDIKERDRFQLLLEEIIVHSPLEGLACNPCLAVTGQDDDRDRLVSLLELEEEMKGVGAGQGMVGQDDVKFPPFQFLQPLLGRGDEGQGGRDLGAVQGIPDQPVVILLRVDDEDREAFFFHFFYKLEGLYLSPMGLTRKVLESFFLLFLLGSFSTARAEGRPSVEEQIRRAVEGRDLLLKRDYEGTEKFLTKLVTDWPNELLGVFGFMALYQVRNLDNFDFRFDPPYRQWEEKGRKMAYRILRDRNASSWDLLVAGGTLGVSGFYRAHNRQWLSGLRDGSTGVHAIQKSYGKDPARLDALLGIGLYDYWRSHFTRKLRFLPFFPDRRKEGREKLVRAVQETEFASVLAEVSLAFIDFEEGKYRKVLEETARLLERYPRNTILLMLRGEALLALKRYPETVRIFGEILSIDPSVTKSHLFIGLAFAKEGADRAKAADHLKKYLEREPRAPSHWRRPAVKKLKELEKKKVSFRTEGSENRTPQEDDRKGFL